MVPSMPSILLIFPPVAKPCEPPAGIALLDAALRAAGVDCAALDLNLDCLLDIMTRCNPGADTWSRRAAGHLSENLAAIRSSALYGCRDRYKRAVMDINRVLQTAGKQAGVGLCLSNYLDPILSPARTKDLLHAAERFSENPFFGSFEKRLGEAMDARSPDIVGFSVNFLSQALCAFAMAGFVRKHAPGARIVMGGGLVTSWMRIPGFANPFQGLVDDLVAGPGEAALLAMAGAREGAGEASPIHCPAGSPNNYLSPVPVFPVITSRGCYWRKCRFCPERWEQGAYRPLPLAAVGEGLARLAGLHSKGLIHFLDNALSPKTLHFLTQHPPGLPWYGFARITRHLTDREVALGLRRSGCVMLKLGVESGNPAVLAALDKGVDPAMASAALRTLKAAGIKTYVYLLFGTPAEDPAAARDTLAFTLEHAEVIDFLNLAVFNLPAYGEDAQGLDTIDFYEGDLSLYREFAHPLGWDRGRVRRFLAKEFTRPAPIRRILGNDPPFFTSNHAPFLGGFPFSSKHVGG